MTKIIKIGIWSLYFFNTIISIHGQESNKSLTYDEVIKQYQELDSLFGEAKMITYGRTDCGEYLHLFVITQTKIFNPTSLHELKKCVLFINNGIHAGEPDGIDASIKLARELLENPIYKRLLENIVVCIIPVFNIDGALQRGCCSRVNQNGPEEYGFRANSKNLDLNRDFMKVDSRSTISLINIIKTWDPDVFVDTHVSDGADYPYSISLISTQHDKMERTAGDFIKNILTPELFKKMKEINDEMIPYVEPVAKNEIPDSGLQAFLETPRFLSGYLSLNNCFSFIVESHMLKPFPVRVKSTHNLLVSFVELCDEMSDKIVSTRAKANSETLLNKYFRFNWKCNYSNKDYINFNGYEATYKPSEVTGGMRLYYDRTKTYKKKIPYFDHFYPSDSFLIPKYFYIPQAFDGIIKLLDLSHVKFLRVNMDSLSTVKATYFTDYKTFDSPYEGHYLHYDVKTRTQNRIIKISKGDFLIPLPQENMKYALEALTPKSEDSYFCWGFFDAFLQQKEWFSSYVFEDIAAETLKKDTILKNDFEKWKIENPGKSDYEKLNFIYQRSPNFEKTYMRYPIFLIC